LAGIIGVRPITMPATVDGRGVSYAVFVFKIRIDSSIRFENGYAQNVGRARPAIHARRKTTKESKRGDLVPSLTSRHLRVGFKADALSADALAKVIPRISLAPILSLHSRT